MSPPSPLSPLLNLMTSKPKQQAPPYNKVAKLPVMTVEVETVLLREQGSGRPAKKQAKYPHYPLLDRTVERVGGGGEGGSPSPAGKSGGGSAASSSSPAAKSSSSPSSVKSWWS